MHSDVVIIGAGVAGLSCGRTLADAGAKVTVLERARGVGGRCATRRVEGQPVDHGVVFLHGSDPDFLRTIESVSGATVLAGWPHTRAGSGSPCQPDAFLPSESRLAYAEGLSLLPKHLARGLDVRLDTAVASIEHDGSSLQLALEGGDRLRTRSLVVSLPTEDISRLVAPICSGNDEARAAVRLLDMILSLPSLTVLAGYPLDAPEPEWDVSYPEDSRVLQLVSHDSAKRTSPRFRVLVFQAQPAWSRNNAGRPPEDWSSLILEEAGKVIGSWAAKPLWSQAHAWHRARVDRGNELTSPILIDLDAGARIGLAGEVFAPGGGVEAAWISGRNLARRLAGGLS